MADPTYRCPKCSKTFAAPASLEGSDAGCPLCGRVVADWPCPISDDREPGGGPERAARYRVAECVFALAAGGFALKAFEVPAVQAAVWAGLACCAAVFARIAQAEAHHAERG